MILSRNFLFKIFFIDLEILLEQILSHAFEFFIDSGFVFDCFGCWGMAYLLIHSAMHHNQKSYDRIYRILSGYIQNLVSGKKQHFKCNLLELIIWKQNKTGQSSLQSCIDFLWANILVLYSSSLIGDIESYQRILSAMMKETKTNSVLEAIQCIPKQDFQAWAMALLYFSASKLNDLKIVNELSSKMEQVISASPNFGDQVISKIMYLKVVLHKIWKNDEPSHSTCLILI